MGAGITREQIEYIRLFEFDICDAIRGGVRARHFQAGSGAVDSFHGGYARIQVKGDTATAHLLYTGLMCDDLRGPPRLIEMGREYDELVKIDGEWLISKRVLSSDAGMQDYYAESYEKR